MMKEPWPVSTRMYLSKKENYVNTKTGKEPDVHAARRGYMGCVGSIGTTNRHSLTHEDVEPIVGFGFGHKSTVGV